MRDKRKRSFCAVVICVILAFNAIGGTDGGLVAMAAQTPDAGEAVQAVELPDPELPPGGLRRPEAYRVDEEAAAHVPSYEGQISRYSRFQTIFQKGTGTYGYENLSDAQQELYLVLEMSLMNFNSSEDAVFQTVKYSDGTVQYTPFKTDFSKFGLGQDEAVQTWAAFRADHTWLFWLGAIAYSSKELMPIVESDYEYDLPAVREMYDTIEAQVSGYLDAAEEAHGTYEKVRVVYDRLINEINYAYKSDGKTPETADWAHSVAGVFDGVHRSGVCEGYAKTFSFIMNILDIPNVYIVGNTPDGGHAWNAVSFDGGATYYYVDATWDDTNGKSNVLPENRYEYFAMPKSVFEKRHVPDTVAGTGLSWQYAMPVLGDDMDYTYFVRYAAYGTSETVGSTAAAKQFLKTARVLAPGESCLMLLPDVDALKNVASVLGIGSFSYSTSKDYGMVLYANPAEGFAAERPADAFSLSETELKVDEMDGESVITITSATANSDDYITFYSSNEKVASVKTAYVKAKQGESIHIVIRGEGTAEIYAMSSAGKATASCRITVRGDVPDVRPTPLVTPTAAAPTATPEETEEPSEEPTPIATPTVTPTATPTVTPTVTPTMPPMPFVTPTVMPPTETPEETGEPSEEPTPIVPPIATPIATPTATPEETGEPTEGPTPLVPSTATPIVTPSPTPAPTATPEETGEPTEGPTPLVPPIVTPSSTPTPIVTPTATPEETGEPTENPTAVPTETPTEIPTAEPLPTTMPAATPGETPIPTGKPTEPPAQPTMPNTVSTPSPAPTPGGTDAPVENKPNTLKKGDSFVVGNLKFKVTKLTGKTGEVTVIGVKSKKAASIVIPNKISRNGISFAITSIQKNAFKGCKKAKKLKISATGIKKITKISLNGLIRKIKITVPKSKAAQFKKMLKKCGFTNVK